MLLAANNLGEIYKGKRQNDSTIRYLEMSITLKEELFAQEKERKFQNLAFDEQVRRQEGELAEIQAAKEREKNLQLLAITAFIITFIVIVIVINQKVTMENSPLLGLIGVLLILNLLTSSHPLIEA
jgi:K+-sensing histidine kinase KdpD